MNNKFKILFLCSLVAIITLFVGNFYHNPSSNVTFGAEQINKLSGSAAVSTGPTVSNTSGSVLAASSGRQYAIFTNDSSTVPVYLSFTGTTAAVAHTGIAIEPLATFVINLDNQYVGQVNAITASSTAVLTVTAFQ